MTEDFSRSGIADERYRLLVDSITDYAIYMIDADGFIASWNAGAERFKLYSEKEILGKHFSSFYTSEDRERNLPERALRTAATEGRFEGEGWRIRKDGTRFWAHGVIDPIRSTNGEILGYAKITRDLSERKAAEDKLRKSEQQFRLLVEGVTDYAIYMMDPQGHVSSWNAGAQHIKQYTAEEIIGEHFSRFYGEEDRQAGLPQRALSVATSVGRYESEEWRRRRDGTRFWANAIIDAIRDEKGNLLGFAKITRDITQKRETERELHIAREELFQAQKMEAVGQLTGGMAHDFNNLLMAIQGSLELLRKRVPPAPETTRLLSNALQATQRGASLTQRMLAFSRRQELKLEAVNLTDLVKDTAEILQRTLGPTIVIETQFPVDLPLMTGDANQLLNALINLAINARDAMPKGGFLTISATTDARGLPAELSRSKKKFVCLSVRDEGEGMDKETLEKATTPFFTTKGVGKGTGLGLPMVQGVVAQCGGQFVLKSELGSGTTAELWLPLTSTKMESVEAQTEQIVSNSAKLTVLAVDDDPLVLMNTVMMLEDLGHKVIEANSAKEAIEALEEAAPDLIITDHAMPAMTGTELAALVAERWSGIPVILASGYADIPGKPGESLPRLGKPFTQTDLAKAVANATNGLTN